MKEYLERVMDGVKFIKKETKARIKGLNDWYYRRRGMFQSVTSGERHDSTHEYIFHNRLKDAKDADLVSRFSVIYEHVYLRHLEKLAEALMHVTGLPVVSELSRQAMLEAAQAAALYVIEAKYGRWAKLLPAFVPGEDAPVWKPGIPHLVIRVGIKYRGGADLIAYAEIGQRMPPGHGRLQPFVSFERSEYGYSKPRRKR